MGEQQEAGGTGDHWDAANVEGGKGILVLEFGAERKSGKVRRPAEPDWIRWVKNRTRRRGKMGSGPWRGGAEREKTSENFFPPIFGNPDSACPRTNTPIGSSAPTLATKNRNCKVGYFFNESKYSS